MKWTLPFASFAFTLGGIPENRSKQHKLCWPTSVGSPGLWTWHLEWLTILATLASSLELQRCSALRPASCVSTYCGAAFEWEVCEKWFPQLTMQPLGNVNTPSTWGQASRARLEVPCKERHFGVPLIYSGQWKINMPVKSIFKSEREVSRPHCFCWMQVCLLWCI